MLRTSKMLVIEFSFTLSVSKGIHLEFGKRLSWAKIIDFHRILISLRLQRNQVASISSYRSICSSVWKSDPSRKVLNNVYLLIDSHIQMFGLKLIA
jgi:hypothetical protein